ncbi:MAG: arginine--tRNA ligase [Deltaproteobacteria bacterium]|nr:arginine--tRNA ligase [Deltaproteobacteria bacterium]
MKRKLEKLLADAVERLKWPPVPVTLELPKQKGHGDLATPAAFLLAGPAKKSPRDVAALIVEKLKPLPAWIEKAEVAGPGFINFTIHGSAYFEALGNIFKQKGKFGSSRWGEGKKIILEFVSANPTGPLNVVSARAAAVGDTLAKILKKAGFKPHCEFYVNDVGHQIDLFAQSLEARYREAKGEAAAIPEGGYHGEYLKALAKKLTRTDFKKEGLKAMVAWQKESLKNFGVVFDRWLHQSALMKGPKFEKTLSVLQNKGHLYEQEGALFFRTTAFGDDKDRVVRKSGGEYSYFASDIVYHADKFARKFDRAVDLFGPDHHGYVARTQAGVQALGFDPARLTILIVQQVNLVRGGKVVKMSKRAGEMVTMDDLLEEVGKDSARFFFLMRSGNTHLDFDLDLAKKQSLDNPVFYVQYAHARIASVFRKAREYKIKFRPAAARADFFDLPEEKELVKRLLEYPEVLLRAAKELEPHGLAFYCLDLAKQFQSYYSRAKEDPRYRVVDPDNLPRAQTKLYLLKNIQIVLQNALGLMGISAPERMESKE